MPSLLQERDLFGDEEGDLYEGMDGDVKEEEYNPDDRVSQALRVRFRGTARCRRGRGDDTASAAQGGYDPSSTGGYGEQGGAAGHAGAGQQQYHQQVGGPALVRRAHAPSDDPLIPRAA